MSGKLRKSFVSVCAMLFGLCFVLLCVSGSQKTADAASQTVEDYYTANFALVGEIDNARDVFTELKESIDAGANEDSAFAKMQDIVEITNEYRSFYSKYNGDYLATEAAVVNTETSKSLDFAAAEFLSKNTSFDKAAILAKFKESDTKLAALKTAQQYFADYVLNAQNRVTATFNELKAANDANPSGDPLKIVDFYDTAALAELTAIANKAVSDIGNITFTSAGQYDFDCALVDQKVAQADSDMRSVDKNEVERIYNTVQDYYAVKAGYVSGDLEASYQSAKTACTNFVANVWPLTSNEIKAKYSVEKAAVDALISGETIIPPIVLDNVSSLSTNDGTVKIEAFTMEGTVETAIKVFPVNSSIKVYNSANGSAQKNASTQISKLNKELTVGYFVYIDIFDGDTEWSGPVFAQGEGKEVYYKVYIDLNKYYDNYVAKADGFLDDLLSKINLQGIFGVDNKLDSIVKAKDQLSADGVNSLCYKYYRENGESKILSLDSELQDGGILMFKTASFSTFSILALDTSTLFTNPIFWLLVAAAVIVLIILIALIFKFYKYKVKFYPNGGSKVKSVRARKGESFMLPRNPVKKGFTFAGWYIDKSLTARSLATRIEKRKTLRLYAKWVVGPGEAKLNSYFEKLRALMLATRSVEFADKFAVREETILAKLYKDETKLRLYLNMSTDVLNDEGYRVMPAPAKDKGFELTTVLKVIDSKQSFCEALALVEELLSDNLLEKDDTIEVPACTEAEKKNGFVFVVKAESFAETLADYYKLLRINAMSYVLKEENDEVEDGAILMRMYLTEDKVDLYLALNVKNYVDAVENDRFADTKAYFEVTDADSAETAIAYIDAMMKDYGLERENSNAEGLEDKTPEEGDGFGYIVRF